VSGFRTALGWHWKKNRLTTGLYTLVLLILLPGLFFLSLSSAMSDYAERADRYVNLGWMQISLAGDMTNYLSVIFGGTALLLALVALLLAVSSFGYLHNRRAVDLFQALPVRRTPMLMGGIVANLLSLLLPLALSMGLVQALGMFYGGLVYPFSGLFVWQAYGLMALETTATYLLFLFMILISGTLLDAGFSYGVLVVGWPSLLLCVEALCVLSLPGINSLFDGKLYLAFVPLFQLMGAFFGYDDEYCFTGAYDQATGTLPTVDVWAMPFDVEATVLLWWGVLTLVLLVLVLVVFRLRKSESAESSNVFPFFRGIIRLLGSLAGGLALGILFYTITPSNWALLAGMVIGSFLTHLIAQAVWMRGLQGFWRTLPAYVLTLAVLAGGSVGMCWDVLGLVKSVPKTSEVSQVGVYLNNYLGEKTGTKTDYLAETGGIYLWSDDGEGISFQNQLTQSDSLEAVQTLHRAVVAQYQPPYLPTSDSDDSDGYSSLTLTYTLKNGATVKRNYGGFITDANQTSCLEAIQGVVSLPEYQLYSLIDTYSGKHIDGINAHLDIGSQEAWNDLLDDEDQWDWDDDYVLYDDYGEDKYSERYDLSDAQKEELWGTFVAELNDPSFCYDPMEEQTALEQDGQYLRCTIDMGYVYREDFSTEITALIQRLMGSDADRVTTMDGYGSFDVPVSCPKTRALMMEYLGITTDGEDSTAQRDDGDSTAQPDDGDSVAQPDDGDSTAQPDEGETEEDTQTTPETEQDTTSEPQA
jgi:hypothetical protein